MLPRQHRLPSIEIPSLMRKGHRLSTGDIQIIYTFTERSISRFACIVSTKVDKRSVVRNKLRRLVRDVVYMNLPFFRSCDMVIVVRSSALLVEKKRAQALITDAFIKAKLLHFSHT